MNKMPWQDKEFLQKKASYCIGVQEERIPKRYLRLYKDIIKIGSQMECYYFPESTQRSYELLATFTKELRMTISNPRSD